MPNKELRKFALELYAADNNDIVKVAGVLARIKKFIKSITNPAYKESLDVINNETREIQEALKVLYNKIDEFSEVVRNGDIDKYKPALKSVESEITNFNQRFIDLQQDCETTITYGIKEFNSPGFIDKFKDKLPKEYGVEIGKEYHKPLRSFEFFKHIETINISEVSQNVFLKKIIKILADYYLSIGEKSPEKIKDLILKNKKEIIINLKNAIRTGSLISVHPRKPAPVVEEGATEKEKRRVERERQKAPINIYWGQTIVKVRTSDIRLPDKSGITVAADVTLIDWRTSPKQYKEYLSVRKIDKVYPSNITYGEFGPEIDHIETDYVEIEKAEPGDITEERIVTPEPDEAAKEISTEKEEPQVESIKSSTRKELFLKLSGQGEQRPFKYTASFNDVEFAKLLAEGYRKAFGKDPSLETLGVGWAQASHEMGRHPTKLPQNNIGNIQAKRSWIDSGNPYYIKDTIEVSQKDGKPYKAPKVAWRAYDTPLDGATVFWKTLSTDYAPVMPWAEAGDPVSYSVALSVNLYYTNQIPAYAKSVTSLYKNFMDKIAPEMEGLVSNPKEPPSKSLPVKSMRGQYSEEQTKAIKGNKPLPEESENSNELNEFDQLINILFSFENIDRNIIKQSLPETDTLIVINGGSYPDKLEYARASARLLKKFLSADVSICGNDDKIELQCSIYGSKDKTVKAVQALCDCSAIGMKKFANKNIEPVVLPDLLSKHAEINCEKLIKNYRVFNLTRFIK